MKRRICGVLALGMVLAVAFGLGGCKKKEPKLTNEASVSGTKNEPVWVTKCAAAFPDSGRGAFYGCGSMIAVENLQLQIQNANARARTDLAKTVDEYVSGFFKDYLDSAAIKAKAGKGLTELEEKKFISGISREVTEGALSEMRIVGHWRNPGDDTLFALARVGVDDVAKNMEIQMRRRVREINLDPAEAVRELDLRIVQKRWE